MTAAPGAPTPEIAGESPATVALRAKLDAAAGTETVVLFTGPVGSGRELAARVLHSSSPRRGGPFVAVPCGALTRQLAESELFGHEKGAFTGAVASHKGLIERASGGTVFFAGVGEIPLEVQPKLLRFLEEKTIVPLGGTERRVDVRVVASTSKDLALEVSRGSFREDLYYRLCVLRIEVPPLAERGGDVIILAERFVSELAREFGRPAPRLTECARDLILRCAWPGNVRELGNCLRGAMVFAKGGELSAKDLGLDAPAKSGARTGPLKARIARIVADAEKRLITEALERSDGNRTAAAKELGLSRRGLQLKMKRYGIR